MVLPVDHFFLLAGCLLELWHFATAFHIYCLQTSSLCLCHSLNPVNTGYGIPCVDILTASFKKQPCSNNNLGSAWKAYIPDARCYIRLASEVSRRQLKVLHFIRAILLLKCVRQTGQQLIMSQMSLLCLSRATTAILTRHLSVSLNDCPCTQTLESVKKNHLQQIFVLTIQADSY